MPITRTRAGPTRLLFAALRAAAAQRVLSLAVAIISAGVVATTLATAGQVVAAERSVLARIDDAAISTIEVVDDEGGAGLNAATVARLASLSSVAWAVGLGPVEDVRPSGLPGADPVPARRITGTSPALDFGPDRNSGLVPWPGATAYVGSISASQLGLVDAVGAVEVTGGIQLPVLGAFSATEPLISLTDNVLVVEPGWTGPVRRVILHVRRPEDVVVTAAAVGDAVGGVDDRRARVEVAEDLALVRAAVRGELEGAGRATVLQTLGAGLALAALTIYAGLQGRRKDFGRRRALGASRGQLTCIVLLQVQVAAAPGAVFGAIGGSIAVTAIAGSGPGWQYPTAILVLTLAAMALAAAVPAMTAAWRDPVSALRVP